MSSPISAQFDPSQFFAQLNASLPPLPGQAGAAPASQVDKLWALAGIHNVDPNTGAPTTKGHAKATGASALSSLGPPPPPKVKVDAHTEAHFNALSQTLHQAIGAGANTKLGAIPQPDLPGGTEPAHGKQTTDVFGKNFDVNAKTNQLTKLLGGALAGLDAFSGNATFALEVLRLKHGQANVKQLKDLSKLSSDMQQAAADQQLAKAQDAAKAAEKAHKKAGKMGIFSKLLDVVFAIVSVIAVLASPLSGGATLCIIGAMATAFAVAGFVSGAKSGKGFDPFAGLQIASYVGDGLLMAAFAKAALEAGLKLLTNEAAKGSAKAGAKTASEQVTKVVAEVGKTGSLDISKVAVDGVSRDVTESILNGIKETAERSQRKLAEKVLAEATKNGVKSDVALKNALETIAKGQVKGTGNKLVTRAFDKVTLSAAVEKAASEAAKKGLDPIAKKAAEQVAADESKRLLELTGRSVGTQLGHAGGSLAVQNANKIGTDALAQLLEKQLSKQAIRQLFRDTFKESLTGTLSNLDKAAAKVGLGTGGKAAAVGNQVRVLGGNPILLNAGLQIGTAGLDLAKNAAVQYPQQRFQADSDEATAESKAWKALYDVATGSYKTLEDALQNIVSGHSQDVKDISKLLNNTQQTNQSILSHWNI